MCVTSFLKDGVCSIGPLPALAVSVRCWGSWQRSCVCTPCNILPSFLSSRGLTDDILFSAVLQCVSFDRFGQPTPIRPALLCAASVGMSLFCTGWTYIWLLILPFGLFPEAGWFELFPVAIMATMMLGLEDLTIQLEDPFKYIR